MNSVIYVGMEVRKALSNQMNTIDLCSHLAI